MSTASMNSNMISSVQPPLHLRNCGTQGSTKDCLDRLERRGGCSTCSSGFDSGGGRMRYCHLRSS